MINWEKYKYLQDIVLLIIFQFRQAHWQFGIPTILLPSIGLRCVLNFCNGQLLLVLVPYFQKYSFTMLDSLFFSSTVMLVMTWSLSVSWVGWSRPFAIQWTTFDKSLKLEINILRVSRVACDVMVSMVSMKPLCAICGDQSSGKHFDAYVCEGCKAFFRLRKLLKKWLKIVRCWQKRFHPNHCAHHLFRRTVRKSLGDKYKCQRNSECKVDDMINAWSILTFHC